jgi:asparagine synthetase B (glutamine-hydrolysing)
MLTTTHNRIEREFFDVTEGRYSRRMADHGRQKTINAKAVELFLHLGYVPGNLTLFDGVFCLPSRCAISLGPHNWKIEKRYYYRDIVDPGRYRGVAARELADLGRLFWGGRDCIKAVPRLSCLSSGGYDSRAILAAAGYKENIQTYTYGTPTHWITK